MNEQKPREAPEAVALDDLYTIEQLADAYPHLLSVPTLRWQLRHREVNGLADAVVALGKKLVISRSRYERWLSSRAAVDRAAAGNWEKRPKAGK